MEKSVLLLSEDGALEASLAEDFRRRGYAISTVSLSQLSVGELPKLVPLAIIISIAADNAGPYNMIDSVRGHYDRAGIPCLALMTATPALENSGFDSVLIEPCHPAQIFLRTISLIRISEMERELNLRLKTLENDFNLRLELPRRTDNKRFKVLFIGKASPEFMVVVNALQQKHVQVVAAFTSFTAFDYLYEKTFDAVVMNGMEGEEPAFTVAQTMRRNAKLYHLPALLLVNRSKFTAVDRAYEAGINDIVDTSSSLEVISDRILEQANFHRLHSNFKHDFNKLGGDACLDMQTGLYNTAYFNAHLTRICQHFDTLDLPVSLCLIRISPTNPEEHDIPISSACMQIGRMLKNLVRIQDVTARLETNLFAIVFPGQCKQQLGVVTERIEAILKCASFSDPLTGDIVDIKLEITLNTLGQGGKESSVA